MKDLLVQIAQALVDDPEQVIRHSLLEEERLTYEDAKFFLVLCTAFINLIKAKS